MGNPGVIDAEFESSNGASVIVDFEEGRVLEYDTKTYGDNVSEDTKTYLCGLKKRPMN